MQNRPALRTVLALLAAAGVMTAPAFSSDINARISAQRAKTQALQQRLQQKRSELHSATVKVGNLQAALDQTNAAIASVNVRLGDLDDLQKSTQRKLWWNTIQLQAAEKTLKLHDDLLKQRLVDAYEHGDTGYVQVLLASRSFSDFVERWQDLRLLIAANQRAVAERRAAEKKVSSAQAGLQATQAALAAQAQEQQRARNQLDILAGERANLVAVADAQRRHVAGEVAEIEDLNASEEAQLEALIVEKQREIAAEEEAQRRAAGIVGQAPSAPGALSWPVSGTITSPFGYRRSPFGGGMEFHQGLDIAAPMGTTVTAASSGTVLSAGWYGGYGNYIVIDHGGGMATGYGHLSQIFVSAGQKVQKGQAIGAVGSTGMSTGPHLHFEVRVNGKATDPAAYLH
ncbi:MAG TPA: peptidoglycan DD-metalloendopeptidase family protein [Candidatus Baltobacteraceae bacterium]|nr:peptidoglycan DD-metalloendopeptidase family protein [Candidatus Baltobacteraceae bacterium]